MGSNDATGASKGIMSINTSAGVTDAWLKMQEQTMMMNKVTMPDVSKLFPDMTKFAAPILTDSTLERMAELSKKMADVATVNFAAKDLERIQKLVDQASVPESVAMTFSENYAALSNGIYKSLNSFKVPAAFYDERLQTSMAAMTASLASAIDTSNIQELLTNASTFRKELEDEEGFDELAEDFFANHPELTESIEDSPALLNLSATERRLIVWFVQFIVVMTVTCVIMNITDEFPEIDRIWTGLGLSGGLGAGQKAVKFTKKALDKLPQEEAE